MGLDFIEIEVDSKLLADAISDERGCAVEIQGLVLSIKSMRESFRGWRLMHKWREANLCADFLADLACDYRGGGAVVRLDSLPDGLGALLLRDLMGLGEMRVVGVG